MKKEKGHVIKTIVFGATLAEIKQTYGTPFFPNTAVSQMAGKPLSQQSKP